MSAGLIPGIDPGEVGTHRVRDYLIRFCFGAGISLVAGVIGMKFGPVLGGVWLGFPAILPASLTLIEKKEGKEAASVDSIGAILGAIAMIAFAIVVSSRGDPLGCGAGTGGGAGRLAGRGGRLVRAGGDPLWPRAVGALA